MNHMIRIQLIGDHGGELDVLSLRFPGDNTDEDISAAISLAISKLVLHVWTLSPGDTIKITEAD